MRITVQVIYILEIHQVNLTSRIGHKALSYTENLFYWGCSQNGELYVLPVGNELERLSKKP